MIVIDAAIAADAPSGPSVQLYDAACGPGAHWLPDRGTVGSAADVRDRDRSEADPWLTGDHHIRMSVELAPAAVL